MISFGQNDSPDSLYSALVEIEQVGAQVYLDGGKAKLRGNVEAVPEGVRATLRARIDSLARYLSGSARLSPDHVLFVSKRLGAFAAPPAFVVGVSVLWVSGVPHFRLTPTVIVWITKQVEAAAKSGKLMDGPLAEAAALISRLGDWVSAHFPPHQIWSAWSRPTRLSDPGREPTWIPGPDAWTTTRKSILVVEEQQCHAA
jgi:hypothetical protein